MLVFWIETYKVNTYTNIVVIDSISPTSGSTEGGTPLEISGVGFDKFGDNTKITVGGNCIAIRLGHFLINYS